MKRIALGLISALILGILGCSSAKQFDVTVTNQTPTTLQLFLTKNHEPYEPGLEPPEVLAFDPDFQGAVMLKPTETGHSKPSMTLKDDQTAVLRVYRTDKPSMVLAISRGNPDRIDVPIPPGVIHLNIRLQDGLMVAESATDELEKKPQ